MTTSAHPLAKKDARAQLLDFIDLICTNQPLRLYRPAKLIEKAIFQGFDLGLNRMEARQVIRRYFCAQGVPLSYKVTENISRVAWDRAEQSQWLGEL